MTIETTIRTKFFVISQSTTGWVVRSKYDIADFDESGEFPTIELAMSAVNEAESILNDADEELAVILSGADESLNRLNFVWN